MGHALPLLIVAWLSGSASLSPRDSETESPRTSKDLHRNSMEESRNLFSPRMDYDEWTPLGRGDPLKNDPTYDYVPPVLERVHYWMDPSKRTPDPPLPNSGVLVLGSRTESAFTTQATTQRYQAFQSKESQADSRIDTSSLLDPFFKLMDVSQFNLNFNSDVDYKPGRIQRPHFQGNKQRTRPPQALQRPPYTMLVPPPPPPLPTPHSTDFATTARTRTAVPATLPTPASDAPPATENATATDPSVLANTENVFKPVAISMPGHVEPDDGAPNEVPPAKPSKRPTSDPSKRQEPLPPPQGKRKASPRPSTDVDAVGKRTEVPPARRGESDHRATVTPPVTSSAAAAARPTALTTDPAFKHHKRPSEPARGPFYLIIQGHSKVKTYGASKNPVNRLLTSNEIKYDEEEAKKTKFGRKARKLGRDAPSRGGGNGVESEEAEGFALAAEEASWSLEETFPGSDGGRSKKRYLESDRDRRKRFLRRNGRLLARAPEDCRTEGRNATAAPDDLDLESLMAASDDYDPADVAEILLKDEGGSGSGFGGLAVSVLGRAQKEAEEM